MSARATHLSVSGPHTLEWRRAALPPLRPGEVLVATRLSAVSLASELSVLAGTDVWAWPQKLGYQTLGVVVDGQGSGPAVGQRVVTTLGHASLGLHRAGQVVAVPDHVPDAVALCLILGEETHKGIRRVAPQPHEEVLIAGAGLLGLLSVFNLTRRRVRAVTVLDPDSARRALARQFGAIACAPGDLPHDRFDVGLECSAAPAGFTEVQGHLRPGGRCAVLSDGNWGRLTLSAEFHRRELTLVASSDGEDYAAYAAWLWGRADPLLETLFQETVAAADLPAALHRWAAGPRPVSALVRWGDAAP